MKRLSFLLIILCIAIDCLAATVLVKNPAELHAAAAKALPGDIIILQNGEWKDAILKLECDGNKEQNITFRAQTPGKVLMTGNSRLHIGGNYIKVEGLYFTKGYAGDNAVISFRINKDKLANNCRVTNCAIIDYNNPKRMDENNWVLFYGKNNQLDHCNFRDKKNMGVLLAVILDDERSRENFHSIDHNYFGHRPPLGSNGGEIIRVGVSQHCQFNSNTRITENFFDKCNGETEIISIKSGSNSISNNIFRESEGSLVLRHGDNNTVQGNVFLGNGKPNTGGVRVINKGQKVIGNTFYKSRGTGFRSPMAIMNGIPNSPAHRYVQVTDAEIIGNVFFESSPLSFGEGSDAERSLPPDNVTFTGNNFVVNADSNVFRAWDAISGFKFANNWVTGPVMQELPAGFEKTRVKHTPGVFGQMSRIRNLEKNTLSAAGAAWFPKSMSTTTAVKPVTVDCKTVEQVYKQVELNRAVTIRLTGTDYIFHKPLLITSAIRIHTTQTGFINLHTVPGMLSLFELNNNGSLTLQGLKLDGDDVKAKNLVSNDSSGPSAHFNIVINKCNFRSFSRNYGCENFIYLFKSSIADSIIIRNSSFSENAFNVLVMNNEKDDKGYYNAEKIRLIKNSFTSNKGMLLDLYRGGNDESTLGPDLELNENAFDNCNTEDSLPLISLTGIQKSGLYFNSFMDCNPRKTLIQYKDTVRALHLLTRNVISRSGSIEPNAFVIDEKNMIQ